MAVTRDEMRLLLNDLANSLGQSMREAAMISGAGAMTIPVFLARFQNRPNKVVEVEPLLTEGPGGISPELWSRGVRIMSPRYPFNAMTDEDFLAPSTWRAVDRFLQAMMQVQPDTLPLGVLPAGQTMAGALLGWLDWANPLLAGTFGAREPHMFGILTRIFPYGWPGLSEASWGDVRYWVRYWAHRAGRLQLLNALKNLNFPENLGQAIEPLVIKGRFFRMFQSGLTRRQGYLFVERLFKDANWLRQIRDLADSAGAGEVSTLDVFKAYFGNPPHKTLAVRVQEAWSEGYLRLFVMMDPEEFTRLVDHEEAPEGFAAVVGYEPFDPAHPPATHEELLEELEAFAGLTEHLADPRLDERHKVLYLSWEDVDDTHPLRHLMEPLRPQDMAEFDPFTGKVVGPGPKLHLVFYKTWVQVEVNKYFRGLDHLPWPFGWVSDLRDRTARLFPWEIAFPLCIPAVIWILFQWGIPWEWSRLLALPLLTRGIFGWLSGWPYRVTLDNWLQIPGHFWGAWKAQGLLRRLLYMFGITAAEAREIPVGPDTPGAYVLGVVSGALLGLAAGIYLDNPLLVFWGAVVYGLMGTSFLMGLNLAARTFAAGQEAFFITPRGVFTIHLLVALASIVAFIWRPGWTPPHL